MVRVRRSLLDEDDDGVAPLRLSWQRLPPAEVLPRAVPASRKPQRLRKWMEFAPAISPTWLWGQKPSVGAAGSDP